MFDSYVICFSSNQILHKNLAEFTAWNTRQTCAPFLIWVLIQCESDENADAVLTGVVDPDLGAGAFLTPGSGMGRKSASGSGIRDEQPDHIF